jgi:cytoskeletal protein RodZ
MDNQQQPLVPPPLTNLNPVVQPHPPLGSAPSETTLPATPQSAIYPQAVNAQSPPGPSQPEYLPASGFKKNAQTSFDKKPVTSKNILVIAVLLSIACLLVGGYLWRQHSNANSRTPVSTTQQTKINSFEAKQSPVTQATPKSTISSTSTPTTAPRQNPNTSSPNTSSPTAPITRLTCTTEECFTPAFTSCSPATLDFDAGFAAVHYEIYGPKNNACSMLLKYTSNPNPDWVDKDFICNFDNKQAFEDSVGAAISSPSGYACSGALVPLL